MKLAEALQLRADLQKRFRESAEKLYSKILSDLYGGEL